MSLFPDIPFAGLTCQEALERLAERIERREPGYVCFCEANLYAQAARRADVVAALQGSCLTFADGIAVLKIANLLGHRLTERVPGPSFLLAACDYGRSLGWRHYFYGGADGVAQRLAGKLAADYPGLDVAGTFSPPFRPLDETEMRQHAAMIEAARPDLLWVGLGGPKQEFWMAEQLGKLDVPVMLGVGAAFDFHSGHRPWAPRWIRAIGMEWAFRMATGGPRTLRRNIGCVSVVGGLFILAKLRHLAGPPKLGNT